MSETSFSPKHLFEPVAIGPLTLKNRLLRGALMQRFVAKDGIVTEEEADDLEAVAKGGAAMIITGMMAIDAQSSALSQMVRVDDPRFVETYAPVASRVHAAGSLLTAQICHCGAKAEATEGALLAPSDIAMPHGSARAMTLEEISAAVQAFVAAAAKAQQAGVDAIELHAAHGYLLSEFLSPYFNRRTDDYGGSLENRARFLLETLRAVREAVGDTYPVLVKINGTDSVSPGLTKEECVAVSKMLEQAGCTAIEVSGGLSVTRDSSPARRESGAFLAEANAVADAVSLPVITICGYRDPDAMDEILAKSNIAAFALSRPLICEQDLPNRWQSGDRTPSHCISCSCCFLAEHRGCPRLQDAARRAQEKATKDAQN